MRLMIPVYYEETTNNSTEELRSARNDRNSGIDNESHRLVSIGIANDTNDVKIPTGALSAAVHIA